MAQTQIASIIQQAMSLIDDVRLTQQLAENPSLFYRRMNGYVSLAIPLMSSPPELYSYVTSAYQESAYADFAWVSTEESMSAETQVATGCKGYDLCSVSLMSADGRSTTPYTDASYDPVTGIVTFPVQSAEGLMYEIDFYEDGSFAELSAQEMRLFALAVALMWNERLNNNWLNIQPKIKDSSFETINESNYIDKMTQRGRELRLEFTDEIKKYEQMVTYERVVHNHRTLPGQL